MEKLDYYEGQVLNGKFHGKGKFTSSKGIIAEGSFEHGYLNVIGKRKRRHNNH